MPIEKEISVREAIKIVSISHGQGFKQCNCKLVSLAKEANSIAIKTVLSAIQGVIKEKIRL